MENNTQVHDINYFREQYPIVLKEMAMKSDIQNNNNRSMSILKDSMWLIECEKTDVPEHPFCMYYHESGNLYGLTGFKDEPSFVEACKSLLMNTWGIQFS